MLAAVAKHHEELEAYLTEMRRLRGSMLGLDTLPDTSEALLADAVVSLVDKITMSPHHTVHPTMGPAAVGPNRVDPVGESKRTSGLKSSGAVSSRKAAVSPSNIVSGSKPSMSAGRAGSSIKAEGRSTVAGDHLVTVPSSSTPNPDPSVSGLEEAKSEAEPAASTSDVVGVDSAAPYAPSVVEPPAISSQGPSDEASLSGATIAVATLVDASPLCSDGKSDGNEEVVEESNRDEMSTLQPPPELGVQVHHWRDASSPVKCYLVYPFDATGLFGTTPGDVHCLPCLYTSVRCMWSFCRPRGVREDHAPASRRERCA